MKPIKKACQVCGDKACGINYEVYSCKSCKIFFHRNSSKYQSLICRHQGNCPIDVITRMCCGKCRLQKCLSVGMIRKPAATSKSDESTPNDSTKHSNTSKLLVDDFLHHSIATHMHEFGDNYHVYEPKARLKISTRKKRYATDLNAYEHALIEDVQNARKIFVDEFSVPIIRPTSQAVEIFKIPEIYFRWTIKYCKYFAAFNCLSSDDKFALLKPFSFDLTAIHFAFMYDPATNGYPMFENDSIDHAIFVIYNLGGSKNEDICKMNRRFWVSLHEAMENDSTIRDLVSAQRLFLIQETVSCPEFISYNYSLYSRLLLRYMEHKYKNISQARQKYSKLMRVFNDINLVKQNERTLVFRDFDPDHIPQLVREMYHFQCAGAK